MNKITSAITCVNCKNVLKSPVFLPCSHSICKKHTNKRNSDGELKAVLCHACEIEHPMPASGEFPPNAQLAEIIESRINEIDFGKDYNDAKQSCEQFDEMLTKIEQLLADPRNYTYETINVLKNKIQMRGEELKLKIDGKMNELFEKVSEYENECKGFLTTSGYREKFDKLKLSKDSARNDLTTWHETLDQMKRNEIEWQNIRKSSENAIENFKSQLSRYQTDLLLDKPRYEQLSKQIDQVFRNLEADPQFNLELGSPRIVDSKILNTTNLKDRLFKICGLDATSQRFELLYRGSVHGFRAADFHSRCDNIPRTLTIVKSNIGNIFGGYAEATWDMSAKWKCDKNAYLFSLINRKNVPFKANVADDLESRAIFCNPNKGPVFGEDMVIGDNSNSCRSNYSNFGVSYQLPFMQKTFFAGASVFGLEDIEVFRLI